MPLMFLNGGAMRGGPLHHLLDGAPLVAATETAPRYRFYSVAGRFPGLLPVAHGGAAIAGEVYDVPMDVLRDRLLPAEPLELELGVIELADGSSSLAMLLRRRPRPRRRAGRHHRVRRLARLPGGGVVMSPPRADLVVRSRRTLLPEEERPASVAVRDGTIVAVGGHASPPPADRRVDLGDTALLPGLVDTHVHVNEPGRTEWEGFATATRAAAAGGVTTIVDMPLNSLPPVTAPGALAAKSDHSPCPQELKRGGFGEAWGGICGLQLGLPAVWTSARERGHDLADVVRWMSAAPAALAGIPGKGAIAVGNDADLVAFAADETFTVDPAALRTRHRLTPYAGRELTGVVRATWLRGEPVGDTPRGRLLRR